MEYMMRSGQLSVETEILCATLIKIECKNVVYIMFTSNCGRIENLGPFRGHNCGIQDGQSLKETEILWQFKLCSALINLKNRMQNVVSICRAHKKL